MTQRTRDPISFQRLGRRAVQADFNGGTLTTDAGVLLLREVDRRLSLVDRADAAIPDPRDPRFVRHPQRDLLAARILAIACGYEDGNDHATLRRDPALQAAVGREPDAAAPLASPATLSRLENRVSRGSMYRLHAVLVDTFLSSYARPPAEITLDLDATDDPAHGRQAGIAFNGFYDGYCYLPLYVFCGEQLLVAYLRPGNSGAAKHVRAILKLLVRRIRARWPDTRIILRGDSGMYGPKLLRWCDRAGLGYVFGLQKNDVLCRELRAEMDAAAAEYRRVGCKQRRFAWFRYRGRRWKQPRWVLGKAEHTDKGANPRFLVTNLLGDPRGDAADDPPACEPGRFHDEWYCPRGEMENRIKEQQLYLFADRTSCSDFLANQFRLLLSGLAYTLIQAVRRLGLCDTEAARWRADTIRLRLLKIAARVVVSARRVVLHLAGGCPHEELFRHAAGRLCGSG